MNEIFSWPLIKARLREAILVLPHFFRNPIQGMRTIPNWEWPEALILQSVFAAGCAVLGNAIAGRFWYMFAGLILGPLTQIILATISAGFFYYLFLFFFHREISFRQIYLHLMFAAIPAMLCNLIVPFAPPALLVGLAASGFLLFTGFADNFGLDRVKLRNILVAMYGIFLVTWIVQLITMSSRHEQLREKATPASMDILEKELNP